MYQLPETTPRRKPRPPHRKSDAIRDLEALATDAAIHNHPNVDPKYIAPRVYSDRTANNLTRAIIDYLRLSNCQAERINCTGRYVDNTVIVTDVLDRKRRIGTATWLPTSGSKGTADISATIRGLSVKIEVKMKDKQSDDQRKYQAEVERAGGRYWLCHSFEEFRQMFDNI